MYFIVCATIIIISENKLFLGVAMYKGTLIFYYFLIDVFTDLDKTSILHWLEKNGKGYIQVTVCISSGSNFIPVVGP